MFYSFRSKAVLLVASLSLDISMPCVSTRLLPFGGLNGVGLNIGRIIDANAE